MTSPDLPANAPLHEARQWLRERVEVGENCPVCGQFAKVYRRKIHHTIARALIDIYRLATPKNDWFVHVPSAISPACEVGKARYWGLLEESPVARPDGGRAGWWRLTQAGIDFVKHRSTVPVYARIYNGRCLGLVGDHVTIAQALGDKFDYGELMGDPHGEHSPVKS